MCRTVILPFILYVCEVLLLTLSEERREVFGNGVLQWVFGLKMEGATGD
jgi:hypothetical protein